MRSVRVTSRWLFIVAIVFLIGAPRAGAGPLDTDPLNTRVAPWDEFRSSRDGIDVHVGGRWYRLQSVEGMSTAKLMGASKALYGRNWEHGLKTKLVPVLTRLGRVPGALVRMEGLHLPRKKFTRLSGVAMTRYNFHAVGGDRARSPSGGFPSNANPSNANPSNANPSNRASQPKRGTHQTPFRKMPTVVSGPRKNSGSITRLEQERPNPVVTKRKEPRPWPYRKPPLVRNQPKDAAPPNTEPASKHPTGENSSVHPKTPTNDSETPRTETRDTSAKGNASPGVDSSDPKENGRVASNDSKKTVSPDAPSSERAPWNALRVSDETSNIEVKVDGTWYRLRKINNVKDLYLKIHSKEMHGIRWKEMLATSLDAIMDKMGRKANDTVRLHVESLDDGTPSTLLDVPMTGERGAQTKKAWLRRGIDDTTARGAEARDAGQASGEQPEEGALVEGASKMQPMNADTSAEKPSEWSMPAESDPLTPQDLARTSESPRSGPTIEDDANDGEPDPAEPTTLAAKPGASLASILPRKNSTESTHLSADQLGSDVDALARILSDHYAHQPLQKIACKSVVNSIRAMIPKEGLSARTFAITVHQALCSLGDSASGVAGISRLLGAPGYVDLSFASCGDRVIATNTDGSAAGSSKTPFVFEMDGVSIDQWRAEAQKLVPAGTKSLRNTDAVSLMRQVDYLRGALGIDRRGPVTLRLESQDRGDTSELTRPLAKGSALVFQNEAVTSRRRSGDVGYLRIRSFGDDASIASTIRKRMSELHSSKALIIDLRGAQGTSMKPVDALLPYFLAQSDSHRPVAVLGIRTSTSKKDKVLVDRLDAMGFYPPHSPKWSAREQVEVRILVDRLIEKRKLKRSDFDRWFVHSVHAITDPSSPIYKGRVSVLIDEATRGAAEVLAASLKGRRNVTLLGEPTAGGFPVSTRHTLPSSNLKIDLAAAVALDTGGRSLEGVSQVPDVVVAPHWQDYVNETRDAQLKEAHDRLLKGSEGK